MKITYIANASIPSTSANSVHIMKICEAFKELEVDIELIVPNIGSKELLNNKKSVFDFYGIKNKFIIKYEQLISRTPVGIYNYLFALISVVKSLFKNNIIYTRNPIVSFFCIIFRKKHFIELHGELKFISFKLFKLFKLFNSKSILNVVVISNALKEHYVNTYNIEYNKIMTLHDGVTISNFDTIRRNIFSNSSFNIVYVGSLNQGKGIETILEIAKYSNYTFHIYGGEEQQIKELQKNNLSNIIFYGHIDNSLVPSVLEEADIVLMPYSKKVFGRGSDDISKWMSPLKMFEYMASGRAIISSDLPVIREVLNEDNAYLVPPDDIDKWIKTIQHIQLNKEEALKKTNIAKKDVIKYSWNSRVKSIMEIVDE